MPFHPVLVAFGGNLKIVGHGPSTEISMRPTFPTIDERGGQEWRKTVPGPGAASAAPRVLEAATAALWDLGKVPRMWLTVEPFWTL